jgi:DNA-binding transcriptional ArsR family regulator
MDGNSNCKVERNTERYGLTVPSSTHDSIDKYLLHRWLGEGERVAEGYRSLTEWFNKRLLRSAYDAQSRETLATQLDADYEILTGEDDLEREELLDILAAEGIDGEELRRDMISWGTMRNHLKECLGGEKGAPDARTDWERESVRIASDKTADQVNEALGSLESKGQLDGGKTTTVEIQVQLTCDECPRRVPLETALERGYVCAEHHTPATPSEETQ